jgi:hypothetical protein
MALQTLNKDSQRKLLATFLLVVLAPPHVYGDKFCGVDLEDAQNTVRLRVLFYIRAIIELTNLSFSAGNPVALIATAVPQLNVASRLNRRVAAPI